MTIANLQASLNDLDPGVRADALGRLASLARAKAVALEPEADLVNMHCHTFFSFNAYGHSPTSLAWLGRLHGLRAMGIVDFDVLDGVDEFLDACERVGVRGSAGIETRVFIPQYAGREINSPGEPGVCYHMGIGLTHGDAPGEVAPILADLGRRAHARNQDMIGFINEVLRPVAIDYRRDVLPLTPSGHPTERHLVVAYLRAAERTVPDPPAFWAGVLGEGREEVAALMPDRPALQSMIRARLMKRGGAGHGRPAAESFPSLEAFHKLITACGALPCAAWLDGTTSTEQQVGEWLEFLVQKGVVALNLIPERNWNIADPQARRRRVGELYRIVDLAREMDLPLNIGTEMNSFGQPMVDDLDAAELLPVRQAFLDGAFFVYGHTALQRAMGLGYQSDWAGSFLPSRRQRKEFYTQAGRRVPAGKRGQALLRRLEPDMSPDEVMEELGKRVAGRSEG